MFATSHMTSVMMHIPEAQCQGFLACVGLGDAQHAVLGQTHMAQSSNDFDFTYISWWVFCGVRARNPCAEP